jgi:hypothetical protein
MECNGVKYEFHTTTNPPYEISHEDKVGRDGNEFTCLYVTTYPRAPMKRTE